MVLNLRIVIFVLCSFLFPILCFPSLFQNADSPCTSGRVCTPVPECPTATEEIRKTRKHGLTSCGFSGVEQGSTEIVCCPDAKNSELNAEVDGVWEKIDDNKKVTRVGERKSKVACKEFMTKLQTGVEYHILGGENATLGEFPHMAHIGYDDIETSSGIGWKCGGTLISERYVLTAAHCAIAQQGGSPPRMVRLGMVDLLGRDNITPQTFVIRNITIHRQYNRLSKINDIALLELENEVQIDSNVLPACLYQEADDPSGLIITGWGHTYSGGESSNILQKAEIHSVDVIECTKVYEKRTLKPITATQICAVSDDGSKDTCQGDSGGPLQIHLTNSSYIYTIIGVTSFGMGCGGHVPGVYTRVYSFLDWIEGIVWP